MQEVHQESNCEEELRDTGLKLTKPVLTTMILMPEKDLNFILKVFLTNEKFKKPSIKPKRTFYPVKTLPLL